MQIPSPLHVSNRFSSAVLQATLSIILGAAASKIDVFRGEAFDVDPNSGFFPAKPLQRLPEEFEIWEHALEEARDVVTLAEDHRPESLSKRPQGEQWRDSIRSWPVLSPANLDGNVRLLQRAHMVLASLMHFYVHSAPATEPRSPIHIPRSLAVPLLEVSNKLSMAPVLTFADTVLWNWDLIDPELPLSVENMRYVNIFSGTETERQFYLTSAAVELKGVEMLRIFEGFMNLRDFTDAFTIHKLTTDLARLAKIVDQLTEIFRSIRSNVDPDEFYWACRPWWSGATSSGSHEGWVFDGVSDSTDLDLGGASAGQSSVMHALDIFLDVDHKLAKTRLPAPSAPNKRSDCGFMERMRRYMPGKHRQYLERLASVRDIVQQTPCLVAPYNAAISSLKILRDVHLRTVVLYVVTKTDKPMAGFGPSLEAEGGCPNRQGPVKGTGGSDVCTLLKAGRDATQRTLLTEGC